MAQSGPETLAQLCREPGQPTLREQLKREGKPLSWVQRNCRWALQPGQSFLEIPRSQRQKGTSAPTVAPSTEVSEKVTPEPVPSQPAVPDKVGAPRVEALELPAKPSLGGDKADPEVLADSPKEKTPPLETSSPSRQGWQLSGAQWDGLYEERGFEVPVQGGQFGLRYQYHFPAGGIIGLLQQGQQGEGKAQIGDTQGRLIAEQWQVGSLAGWEWGGERSLRVQVQILGGWQESRLNYRHEEASGQVQFSEMIRVGQAWWGYEISPGWQIGPHWLLGVRWQHQENSVQLRYGNGTTARLRSKPAWQLWIEYLQSTP